MATIDKNKANERNKLIRSMKNMSLQELIDMGSCDHNCPRWYPNGCGCCNCKENNGYYKDGEIEDRVKEGFITELEKQHILKILEDGALDKNGCILERKFRSKDCLVMLCNPFRKIAI